MLQKGRIDYFVDIKGELKEIYDKVSENNTDDIEESMKKVDKNRKIEVPIFHKEEMDELTKDQVSIIEVFKGAIEFEEKGQKFYHEIAEKID